ncbi:hypothetical protein [Paludibaculum fermentans]|uniref:hypothetical protein n=1 Tax=Paludibaculum fermentans TaxID=1473598 RepID=UPI003EBFAC26
MFDINREHPEYTAWKRVWPRYRDLYLGGEQFTANADRYLIPRHKEPPEVYQERVSRAFYENYIGSIIDWYAATLFRREPLVTLEGHDDGARKFFNALAEDCDRQGSTLSDFFRKQVIEALVMGRSYIVLDFPRLGVQAGSKAEEDALGLSRGYFSQYPAQSAIHWQRDESGEYEWVVLRGERLVGGGDEPGHIERQWVRYDRERFAIFRQDERDGAQAAIVQVDEGRHGLAGLGKVPVFEFTLGDGMWLMNKASSLQLEHFNKSNALAWALTMGLFSMPVIYSEKEFKQTMGESYYVQLGKDDRFGWTEPEGHVFEIALQNTDRLKEEIYRICYMMSQAGGALSKNSAMTGLSKQRDYLVTQEVLRGFGDKVKDTLKRLLRTLAAARQDEIEIGVSGLDEFDIGEFSSELEDAQRLLSLGIPSKTLETQIQKKLAMKYLCDASQQVKDRIAQEIDAQATA